MSAPLVNGRGAWSLSGKDNDTVRYAYIPNRILDGSRKDASINHEAVYYAVKAIQARCNELLTTADIVVDGKYGVSTANAVKQVQQMYGLVQDGTVGIITSRTLWRPLVALNGRKYNFDPRYLWGRISLESSFDAGAVGYSNSGDRGIAQVNLPSHPDITVAQAFEVHYALDFAANNFRESLDRYVGKPSIQLACAIARYNSPLWANMWYNYGYPPNSTIKAYVDATLQNAASY